SFPLVKRPQLLSVYAVFLLASPELCLAQNILPPETNAPAGERPYEMVWANRTEQAPATVRFDHLDGWRLEAENRAQATLQVTRAQNVWNRPVARLRYHGEGKSESKPRILLIPPKPIALPENSASVDIWLYGNRWDWESPPGTPPSRIVLHLHDGAGKEHDLLVDKVRWQEWWLMHKKLPATEAGPLRLESVEVADGWQADWREIFFDS